MSKINVLDVDRKLRDAGVLIDGVALDRPGKKGVSIDFQKEATDEQKALAAQIVKDYDQDAVNAAKEKPVSIDDINNLKTIADVKALLIKQYQIKG